MFMDGCCCFFKKHGPHVCVYNNIYICITITCVVYSFRETESSDQMKYIL